MQFGEPADWRDEDLYAIGAQPLPGRRARAYRRLPWFRIGLTSAAFIALIAVYAPDRENPQKTAPHSLLGEPPQLLTPPSQWRNLAEGSLAIVMQDERLAGLPLAYAARVHDEGTIQDIIELGRFRSSAAYFRVLLERKPDDTATRSFFVDLALSAAQAGLAVVRTLPEEALDTRDGRLEVARVQLENGLQRDCLAFRSVTSTGAGQDLGMKQFGWVCAPELTREDLACAMDGLQLRHRETGLLLNAPIVEGRQQLTDCDPKFDQTTALTVDAAPPVETTASLAPQQTPPPPPRRPSEQ